MLRRNTILWHHKRGSWLEATLYGLSARFLASLRAKLARLQGRADAAQFEYYSQRLTEWIVVYVRAALWGNGSVHR